MTTESSSANVDQAADIVLVESEDSSDTVIYNSDTERAQYRSLPSHDDVHDVEDHSTINSSRDPVPLTSVSQPEIRSHHRLHRLVYFRPNSLINDVDSSSEDDTMSLVRRSHRRSSMFLSSQNLTRLQAILTNDEERDLFDVSEQANSSNLREDSPPLRPRTRAFINASHLQRRRSTVFRRSRRSDRINIDVEATEISSDSDGSHLAMPLHSEEFSDSDENSSDRSTTPTISIEDEPNVTHTHPEPLLSNAAVSPPRLSESQADFVVSTVIENRNTTMKRKLSSPEQCNSKKPAVNSPSAGDDDGLSCPICFESWTNSGSHRLISLKCGHIFGMKCIERWLKGTRQNCPQCNAKAKKSDIRVIYAKKLIAVDTVDLEHALRTADKERSERRNHELELAKVRMQYHMAMEECNRLKSRVSELHSELAQQSNENRVLSTSPSVPSCINQGSTNKAFYKLVKSHVILQSGGCRIMDFHSRTQQFVISQPSPHANFMNGFGVKRICGNDLKSGSFTFLHQKPIKDLHFSHLTDHHLLSASQDGGLRITDLMCNAKIHEYKVEKPIWSCCWDRKDRNIIYAGLSNGSLMQFDLRNTSNHLSSIENFNSRCPIVSLHHIPPTADNNFQGRGGLFTGTLEGASFWQDVGSRDDEGPSMIEDFKPTFLPFDQGSCTGLQYCRETQHCLVTYRPGRSYRTTTHLLCEMQCRATEDAAAGAQVTCNVVDTYTGGQTHKMLTRNSLFVLPHHNHSESTLLACVGDEASQKVNIYSPNHNRLVQTLDSDGGPPLDIHPVHMDSSPPMLAILSQNTLKVYKLA